MVTKKHKSIKEEIMFRRNLILAKIPIFGLIFFIICSILFWDIKTGLGFGVMASIYYAVRRWGDWNRGID